MNDKWNKLAIALVAMAFLAVIVPAAVAQAIPAENFYIASISDPRFLPATDFPSNIAASSPDPKSQTIYQKILRDYSGKTD